MPPHLEKVRDKLAENIHELWGMNKIELGWSYGKVRVRLLMRFSYLVAYVVLLQVHRSDQKIKSILHAVFHVCGEINTTITIFSR